VDEPTASPAAAPVAAGLPAAWPAPSTLLRRTSGGGADFRRDAWVTDPGLAPQRATANPDSLGFSPDFTPGAANAGGLAYALYRLNSSGYGGDPTVRLGWALPPDSGSVWIGLADIAGDRWTWRSLPVSNALPVPGGVASHSAASGDFLVVVAVTGTGNDCALSYVRLGDEPPHAVLITTNGGGPVPLTPTFDATSSADLDGTITGYEIDFGQGAGFQAMPGGTIQHTYSAMGVFTATIRVTDNEGAQSQQSTEIDAGVTPNQPPVAALQASSAACLPGDTVNFDASGSSDPDGTIADYEWDPEGDGSYLVNGIPGGSSSKSWLYSQPGTYHPTVRVTDDKGASSTASQTVTVSYGTLDAGRLLDGSGGNYASIGIANGKLCVGYLQGQQLAFVRATTAGGGTWFAPQLLAAGGVGCSLAAVGGNPALAYHDGASSVYFIRASDANGQAWGSPHLIASGSNDFLGVFPALAVIGGVPAIVCNDATAFTSGVSWFVLAGNSTGTTWGTKRRISASGQYGVSTNLLELSDGTPCASLAKSSGTDFSQLQFGLAANTSGSSWNPPIPILDGNCLAGISGGLRLIGGRPAMAYSDADAGKIYFVRAKDASGLEWNAPVYVADSNQAGGYVTMAVVNNLPVIAYLDSSAGLLIAISSGTLGGAWNPPLVVDAAAGGAQPAISMTSFNNAPAIAYCNGSNLKLAHWE
jgi:hypothetical protein